jgi:endonuclease V-like protein UPF0215 family
MGNGEALIVKLKGVTSAFFNMLIIHVVLSEHKYPED